MQDVGIANKFKMEDFASLGSIFLRSRWCNIMDFWVIGFIGFLYLQKK